MPLARCLWYNDDGVPIRDGCRAHRQGTCGFVHPDHLSWDSAPRTRHYEERSGGGGGGGGGGFGTRGGRGRGAGTSGFNDRNATATGANTTPVTSSWGTQAPPKARIDLNEGWGSPPAASTSLLPPQQQNAVSNNNASGGWGSPAAAASAAAAAAASAGWGSPPSASTSKASLKWGAPPSAPSLSMSGGPAGWDDPSGAAWDGPDPSSATLRTTTPSTFGDSAAWGAPASNTSASTFGTASTDAAAREAARPMANPFAFPAEGPATSRDDWATGDKRRRESTSSIGSRGPDITAVRRRTDSLESAQSATDPRLRHKRRTELPVGRTSHSPARSSSGSSAIIDPRKASAKSFANAQAPPKPKTSPFDSLLDPSSSRRNSYIVTERDDNQPRAPSPSLSSTESLSFDVGDVPQKRYIGLIAHTIAVAHDVRELEAQQGRTQRMLRSRQYQFVGTRERTALERVHDKVDRRLRLRKKRRDELLAQLVERSTPPPPPPPAPPSDNVEDLRRFAEEARAWLDAAMPLGRELCGAILGDGTREAETAVQAEAEAEVEAEAPPESATGRAQQQVAILEGKIDDLTEYAQELFRDIHTRIDEEMALISRKLFSTQHPPALTDAAAAEEDTRSVSAIAAGPTGRQGTMLAELVQKQEEQAQRLTGVRETVNTLKARDAQLARGQLEMRSESESLRTQMAALRISKEDMDRRLAERDAENTALRAELARLAPPRPPPPPTVEELARAVHAQMVPVVRAEVMQSVGMLRDGMQAALRQAEREFCTRVWEKLQPVLRHSEAIIKFMDQVAAEPQPPQPQPQLQSQPQPQMLSVE